MSTFLKKVFLFLMLLIALSETFAEDNFVLKNSFPSLTFTKPVGLEFINTAAENLYIIEQIGLIKSLSKTTLRTEIFLDLRDRITNAGNEQGLLGLAFHPNFVENLKFYVHYSSQPKGDTVISEFTANKDIDKFNGNKDSERIFISVKQPYRNHNGGQIAFGPDGFLYISLGDGGSAGDPENYAQNLESLLGKILRIDVNRKGTKREYEIPTDNPFLSSPAAQPEIYAYGLRNVWRFSFDSLTKQLWAADVGQNKLEEINIIRKGGNYGWRFYEGTLKYKCANVACLNGSFKKPVHVYGRDLGYSITGGYVYRGQKLPQLYGKYIFADYVSGRIFALESSYPYAATEILKSNINIASFGESLEKEIYILDHSSGKIFELEDNKIKGK